MRIARTIEEARRAVAQLERPLGFVPTMGALHAGHLRLVERCHDQCAASVVSIFVNPAQFGPQEDFDRYPRDETGDRGKLQTAGVSLLFSPATDEMYPGGFCASVDAGPVALRYEGQARPGHFRGVATIVTKLLHVIRPDVLYVGQKDAQQAVVLRKVIHDLDFGVRVEIVPTVRETDGLAFSSRNAYLTPEQRAAAPSLHRTLHAMLGSLRSGLDADASRARAKQELREPGHLEYLDVVDAGTFEPLAALSGPAFVIAAARFGGTRLIDNIMVPE